MKMDPHEKLIAGSVIEFMNKKFGIKPKIIVKKKDSKGWIGDVVLNDNSVNGNKFYLHVAPGTSYRYMISTMLHELTHVKQISKGELLPTKDWKGIQWKKKPYISVKDYNKLMKTRDIKVYESLPWEKEARANQKKLLKVFFKSPEWNNLRGKSDTMDYVMDNIDY